MRLKIGTNICAVLDANIFEEVSPNMIYFHVDGGLFIADYHNEDVAYSKLDELFKMGYLDITNDSSTLQYYDLGKE